MISGSCVRAYDPAPNPFGNMLRSVLVGLAATSVMGFAPPLGVQRTVVRASGPSCAPTMQFGGSALDGMNEELQKVGALVNPWSWQRQSRPPRPEAPSRFGHAYSDQSEVARSAPVMSLEPVRGAAC